MLRWWVIICCVTCHLALTAADGDTIVVKAHEDVVIQTNPAIGHTEYPVWAEFPDVNTDYYQVYAYLTFECAPGLRCGEWDYINYIKLGRVGGKQGTNYNWELARYITPYGFYWQDGEGWKHGWYMDMTDYASLLRDSVEIIYRHTGYEARNDRGWKINLTFYIVEGKPIREPLHIQPLWNGSFSYGNPNNPIDNNLQPKTVTLQPNTKSATVKVIQSGHGFDNNQGCAEFCPKERTISWDNKVVDQRLIWRECSFNSLFPQAGTWVYDRTNWCPGAPVVAHNIHQFNLTGGSSHTIDMNMEPYTANGNPGNYVFTSYLVEYGAPNYQHDVALHAVMAPSEDYQHLRYNPICDNPIIVIQNNGAQPLTALDIEFGVPNTVQRMESWSGNLAFGEKDTIYLSTPIWWGQGADQLQFNLKNPNGQSDEFAHNNTKTVPVTMPPTYGNQLIVFLLTNKAASENFYYIRDLSNDSIIYSKDNMQNSTLYRDTVMLEDGHCYQFEFYDTGTPPAGVPFLNEDGLGWWANPDDGSGSLRFFHNGGPSVQFGIDFGQKIIHQFRAGWPLGTDQQADASAFEVFPNPTQGAVTVHWEMTGTPQFVSIYNMAGAQVYSQTTPSARGQMQVDVQHLSAGLYMVHLVDQHGAVHQQKLVIQ